MGKYFILAAIVQIIWSLTPSASKLVISEIPIELFISIRWSISGLIFLCIALALEKKFDTSLKNLMKYFTLGVLGYGFSSFGTLYGLKMGGVVNFSLISAGSPIIVALMSIVLLREKVHPQYWKAALLCISGLLFIVMGKQELSGLAMTISSTLLILGAYAFEGLPFIYSKKYQAKQSLICYLATLQLSAAVFMWGSQIFYFKQFGELSNLSIIGLGALVFVSIVACVLCYGIFYWLLKFIEGHKLVLFDGLHSFSAALFGLIFWSEPFNFMMLIGGLLSLSSIWYLYSLKRLRT